MLPQHVLPLVFLFFFLFLFSFSLKYLNLRNEGGQNKAQEFCPVGEGKAKKVYTK